MTDDIAERVARALHDAHLFAKSDYEYVDDARKNQMRILARAALSAIRDSGTHVVVPVENLEKTRPRAGRIPVTR